MSTHRHCMVGEVLNIHANPYVTARAVSHRQVRFSPSPAVVGDMEAQTTRMHVGNLPARFASMR
jgi:hypothetical protein